MAETLHPGVYVKEVPSAIKTIEGVSTSTAAFIGIAERGPIGKATLVTSFNEFNSKFGGFIQNSFLAYSVLNFFENGGKKCYIVRVIGKGAKQASIKLCDRERVGKSDGVLFDIYPKAIAEPIILIKVSSPGRWGNEVDIEIQDDPLDPDNLFKIVVKLAEEVVETWGNLSMIKGDPNYVENMLGPGQSQYIEVDRIETESTATPSLLVSGVLDDSAKNLTDLVDKIPILKIEFYVTDAGSPKTISIEIEKAADGNLIAESIQKKVRKSVPEGASDSEKIAIEDFRCVYVETKDGGRYVLISGFEGKGSNIDVVPAGAGAGQTDVRKRLKLDESQETKIPGKYLQCGSSCSGNEPKTVIGARRKISFNLNRDGFQTIELESGLNSGDDIADNIQSEIKDLAPNRKNPINESAYQKFEAIYYAQYKLTFGEIEQGTISFKFEDTVNDTNLQNSNKLRLSKGVTLLLGGTSSARTISSDSEKDQRPIVSLKGIDGKLGLQYKFEGDWKDTSEISLSSELDTGDKIAAALQEKICDLATTADLTGLSEDEKELFEQALSNFEAKYVAYFQLKSVEVRTKDEAGNKVGPISSIEILPSPNESKDAAKDLKLGITNGGIEQNGAAMLRPQIGEYYLGDHTIGGVVTEVESGDDGADPMDTDFTSNNGIKALDIINDFSLLAIPGMGSKAIVSAGFSYCANRPLNDCFFVADIGSGGPNTPGFDPVNNPLIDSRDAAREFVRGLPTKNDYGAVYFPWVEGPDPIGKGKNPKRFLPPSGYITGVYARVDARRGVFKAPAGTEAKIGGISLPALGLTTTITDTDQDFLNPLGINVIRAFAGSGTVIWGARTLSSDPAWRYVSVRRIAIFLRVSIYSGIQWAVFEPNDENLWSSLRLNIGSFMMRLHREGSFQGKIPSDAFFVKCDSSTTTQGDIDAGVVNILVGFAPLKPAEFVIVKLSQKAGQQTV